MSAADTVTANAVVARIRGLSGEGGPRAQQVRDVLTEALSGRRDWLERRYQQRPADLDWTLYPLYRAPDGTCSVIVAVFRPGASTPVHDHGSWAVIGVYRGRERETWYRRPRPEAGPGPLEVDRAVVNPCGAVSVVPDAVIHSVTALGAEDAISIHVYGTDIVTHERSTFDPRTGAAQPFRPAFTQA